MENEMGRKIKELRQARGMTLEQVATIVGVGKSTVRKWETGMIANMKRDKIQALANALGTTPAYLMGWKEDRREIPFSLRLFGEEPQKTPKLTEGEETLLNLFRKIPEDKQSVVLEMIRLALKTQE
jgi:transcriptional regulator with XRE-family HTH domain